MTSISSTLLSLNFPKVIQLQDFYKEIEEDVGIQENLLVLAISYVGIKEDLLVLATTPTDMSGYAVMDGQLWYKHQLVVPRNS